LVRHAHAGTRRAWHGPDRLRPLDSLGRQQVEAVTGLLVLTAPDRILSATPQRCRETVAPLADRLGLPVKVDAVFDEDSPDGIDGVAAAVRMLSGESGATVVCSQGKVIPPLLAALRPANATKVEEFQTPKGTGWLLAFAGDKLVCADRLVP
jgi:8-oxo-dGTP diphosphatase